MSLFFSLCLSFSVFSFSQTNHQTKRPSETTRPQTSSQSKSIPENACSKEDFEKYAGFNGLWKQWEVQPETEFGFSVTKMPEPPFALFVQVNEQLQNPNYHPPSGYSGYSHYIPTNLPSPWVYKIKNVLHDQAETNFNVLLQHSLSCLSKDKSGFFDSLEEALQQAMFSKEDPNQWSDFLAKQFDTEKRDWIPTGGPDSETGQKLQRFFDKVSSLKDISSLEKNNDSRSLFRSLASYLAQPSQEGTLSHLVDSITHSRPKGSEVGSPAQKRDLMEAHSIAGHIGNIVGDPRLTSYLRQNVMMGRKDRFFTSAEKPTNTETVDQILQDAFSGAFGKKWGPTVRSLQGALGSPSSELSLKAQEEAWSKFDVDFTKHISKRHPDSLDGIRRFLIDGLDKLDSRTPASDPTEILEAALARESILRAMHAIEKVTTNPARERMAEFDPKVADIQESFDDFMHSTQAYLAGRSDPKNKAADALVNDVARKAGVTVPLSVAAALRTKDPLVIKLAASEETHNNESLRRFLQTGYTSALFNLSDSRQAAAVRSFLTDNLESSGVFSSFSEEEKHALLSLLGDSTFIHSDSRLEGAGRELFVESYGPMRKKLLSLITSEDSEKSKVAAWALELLDSTGNHSILSSTDWANPKTHSHYDPSSVIDRFKEEKRLASQHGQLPDPEAALRTLIPGIHGITSEARIASMRRIQNGSEESELIALYRDLLTQGGKVPLSDQQRDALKKLAFSDSKSEDPSTRSKADDLASQIDTIVPGFSAIRSLGPWSESPLSSDILELSPQYRKMLEKETALLQGLRAAYRHLGLSGTEPNSKAIEAIDLLSQEPGLLSQIYSARPSENLNPELVQPISALLRPLLDSRPELKRSLDRIGEEEWRIRRLALGSNPDVSPEPLQDVLSHGDKAVEASARMRAILGKDHPLVQKYDATLRAAFIPGKQTDALLTEKVGDHTARFNREEPRRLQARQQILEQFGKTHSLGWDDSINAFVFTENTKVTSDLLRALEKRAPDMQFVWRDSRTPQLEQMGTLSDLSNRIVNGDQALTLAGISPLLGEWFPVEGSTRILARWKMTPDGKAKLEIDERDAVLRRMEHTIEQTQDFKKAHDRAALAFGSFYHGAKAIVANPFGLGYDPSQSDETKELQRSWNAFSTERSKLGEFGLLALSDGKTGRDQLGHFLELGKHSLKLEREMIQRYVENAETTADLIFMAGTAPLGGLAGSLAKAPKVAGWGGKALWAAQAITSSAKTARDVTIAYGAIEGLSGAYTAYKGNQALQEIKEKYERDGEWRAYITEPRPEDFKGNVAAFRTAWLKWKEEQKWDVNRDGKPDFLDPNLRDYAYRGSESVREFAKGTSTLYRNVFEMSLAGRAMPGTGPLPHIMVPSFLHKEANYLLGAGKAGDFTARQTQSDILKEMALEGALMVPAMTLPGGVMRLMPASMQATIRTPFGPTTTRNLVGASAFVAGNVGVNAAYQAIHGNSPLEGMTLSRAAFDLYIGHSIANQAATKNALADLKNTHFNQSPSSIAPKTLRLGSGPAGPESPTPSQLDALVKRHGQEAVDSALEQLVFSSNPGAVSPELLRVAADRLALRASEARASASKSLEENPFKDKSYSELDQTVRLLEAQLSGRAGLSLSPEVYQEKSASLEHARLALEAKLPEARLSSLAGQARIAHGLEQILSDNITQPIPANAPSELRITEEAIRRIRNSQPSSGTGRWVEQLRETARQGTIWGDLASLVVNPHAPAVTPQQSADRAWKILGDLTENELPPAPAFGDSPFRRQLLIHYVKARANAQLTPEKIALLVSRYGGNSDGRTEVFIDTIDRLSGAFANYVSNRGVPSDHTVYTVHDLFEEFILSEGGAKRLPTGDTKNLPSPPK